MTVSSQDGAVAEQVKRPELKAVDASVQPAPAPAKLKAVPEPKAKRERRPGVAPGARPAPGTRPPVIPTTVTRAELQKVARPRARLRHYGAIASFILIVLLPLCTAIWYLQSRAADQYHSEVGFSIRSEESGAAAAGILGAITQIGSGTASDSDILFEFIRSQQIVEAIDRDLDLRQIYNRPEGDPLFTLGDDATIEDLLAHWRRMVDVRYESQTGIITVRANAFSPEDARAISQAVLAESSRLVNQLSEQAREDAIRYARDDLAEAEAHLHGLRDRLSDFRRENRIVDPTADVAGQMGLLNALQAELAQALVERDMLLSYAGDTDQRVIQVNRRIDAVTARIDEERKGLGFEGADRSMSDVIGSYEEQVVDLEFANAAYTQALAGLSAARAEARRQSRYLAAHVEPTMAEQALYPRRWLLAGLTGLFLLLGWGIAMLVYYNVRDSR